MKNTFICFGVGGSKMPALYGAAKALIQEKGIKPTHISGDSAGSIVALFAGVGKFNIDEEIINAKSKDVFKYSPVNKKGGLNPLSIGRIVKGNHSLGDQSNLKGFIKKNLSKSEFDRFASDKETPNVFIGATNYTKGRKEYFNIKQLPYKKAIDVVYASTCIPILTEGQVIDGDLYFDGGVVDHIGAPFLLSNYHCERIISVYSRPKDNIDAVKNVTKEVAESYKNEDFKLKGVFSIVERTFEMMMRNTSINDEQISDAICQEKGIENIKILMPYSLMTETYKFDPDLNRSMCQIGKYAALNAVEDL